METIKNVSLGVLHGIWDSICGMTLVLHIDEEINRQHAERQEERQRRLRPRTPSPTPSSASAMVREATLRRNLDERSLDSMRQKSDVIEKAAIPFSEKKIAKQVLKCCLLNGGFTWLSIILFEQLLLPILKFILTLCYGSGHAQELHIVWGWLQSILSIIFGMMWVLPIFLLSKIVSSLWFADIANAAYQVRKGRPQLTQSLSKLVADFLFSIFVQMLFLMQSMLVNMLPVRYVGEALCFLHLCLLYSLYSFEYKWFNMGWELHRRLTYLENNWPYFLGFGIPLTVLTNMTSSIIVSSTPLRLFSPVIFVSNLFFNRSSGARITSAAPKAAQQVASHQQQQQNVHRQQHQRRTTSPSAKQHRSHQQHRSSSREGLHRYQQPPPLQPQLTHRRHKGTSPSPSSLRAPADGRGTAAALHGGGGGLRPVIATTVPGAAADAPHTPAQR